MADADEITFVPWGEIELFHNLIKVISKSKQFGASTDSEEGIAAVSFILKAIKTPVRFKGKVKLHGSNGAVALEGSEIRAQSRNQFIGNSGFGKIVADNEKYFKSLIEPSTETQKNKLTIFGEYCGPKIQKGVALMNLKSNIFAVFAIEIEGRLMIEPKDIEDLMTKQGKVSLPSEVYILPWHAEEISIDLNDALDNGCSEELEKIEKIVQEVDRLDPWVKNTFGIEGPGEGLVYYPVNLLENPDNLHRYKTLPKEVFRNFAFKAKGEGHRVVATKTSVQVKPEVAAGAEDYVNLMCPNARMEQGAGEVGGYDMSKMKKFIDWIVKDVQKEGKDELEASGLSWKDVSGPLTRNASTWYSTQAKSAKK